MKMERTNHSNIYKAIHWGTAVLVVLSFLMIWVSEGFEDTPMEEQIIRVHTWIGLTILFLFLPRILITAIGFNRTPISSWQDALARIIHDIIYFCMFALPIMGILILYYDGVDINFFGLMLQEASEKNKEMAHIAEEIHEFIANVFLIVLGLHLIGALKRHFIDKQDVLTKMFFKNKS